MLPDGKSVPCGCCTIRDGRSEWFDFYIPFGALEVVYEEGVVNWYKGEFAACREWAQPLDEWFADIGRAIYAAVPFRLGLIGEEMSGAIYADDLLAIPPFEFRPMLFPDENGVLRWYPDPLWT
jgi:hypothetical protein